MQRCPAVSKSWLCIRRLLWNATLRILPSIYTCRWLASNGLHSFSPTVCFIWNTMKRVAYPDAMPSTFRVVFPHAKRSRMTTFHVEPFTHMAGAICVYKLWLGHRRSLFDAFDRCRPEPLFTLVSFLLPSVLIWYTSTSLVEWILRTLTSASQLNIAGEC